MPRQLRLKPSESVVAHAASRIYAAFIVNGSVKEGDETKWMRKSIEQAIRLCVATDDAVVSDDEVPGLDTI